VISLDLYLDVLCIIARLFELPVVKRDGLPSTTCVSICYRPRLCSFHEPASPWSVSTLTLVGCGLIHCISLPLNDKMQGNGLRTIEIAFVPLRDSDPTKGSIHASLFHQFQIRILYITSYRCPFLYASMVIKLTAYITSILSQTHKHKSRCQSF
jgi:hypothetical protein